MNDDYYDDEVLDFLRDDERTVVFIDGASLYSASSKLQIPVDYKKLLSLFRDNTNLIRVYYYTVVTDGAEHDPLRRLVDFLDYSGYTIVSKLRDGDRYRKGSMDVDLTIDMLRMAPNVDHIVLMSGEGDFKRVVAEVQRSCRVTVISGMHLIADELRRQCDQYIDLKELRMFIKRDYKEEEMAS